MRFSCDSGHACNASRRQLSTPSRDYSGTGTKFFIDQGLVTSWLEGRNCALQHASSHINRGTPMASDNMSIVHRIHVVAGTG